MVLYSWKIKTSFGSIPKLIPKNYHFDARLHLPNAGSICLNCPPAGFAVLSHDAHHQDKYTAKSLPVASRLLMAALLILPHCSEGANWRGVVPGNPLRQGLVGGSRLHLLILCHCTQPESISAQL